MNSRRRGSMRQAVGRLAVSAGATVLVVADYFGTPARVILVEFMLALTQAIFFTHFDTPNPRHGRISSPLSSIIFILYSEMYVVFVVLGTAISA